MKRALLLGLTLAACSSKPDITSHNWNCQKLVNPVIAMSQERNAKIIEITGVREIQNLPGYRIMCIGSAEWSQGYGNVEFGAHVSEGDNLIIEYKQQ